MKEYIKKIKELWKVPRYKALLKLGFYLLFIIFVVSLINNAPKIDTEVPVEKNELYSYEFTYTITQNDTVSVINGVNYKNTEKLTYNDNIYYYKNNDLYLNKEIIKDFEPFPLYKMRYSSISNIAIVNNIIDRTVYTDYETITYKVLGEDFEFDHDFNLIIDKKDNYIVKAIINIPEVNYKIEIEYKNFNSITDLEINV